MSYRRAVFILTSHCILALTSVGRAQTSEEQSQAEKLFKDARQLMVKGDLDNACPRFAESQRLAPASGTLLNLAVCHEHQGRLALAWLEHVEAAQAASRGANSAAAQYAESQARDLEKRLQSTEYAHLRILLNEELRKAAVVVTLDGVMLSAATIEMNLPMDLGRHPIVASDAHGHAWRTAVEVQVPESQELAIPMFIQATSSPASQTAPTLPPGLGTQRIVAIVTGGVGIVGIGLGTTFGLMAASKRSNAREVCSEDKYCSTQEGVDRWNDARSVGNMATVAFVAGGLGLAAAGVLWLTDTPGTPQHPQVGLGLGGVQVRGIW